MANDRAKEVKKWLIDKELTRVEIANDLGVSPTAVWLVIEGKSTSRKIAEHLKKLGCPVDLMDTKVA